MVSGTDYQIKIIHTGNTSVNDISDNFEIVVSELAFTSPVTSDEWIAGNTKTITWTSNLPENVKIELYQGGSLSKIIVESTANDGTHEYNVPGDILLADDYTVKITSTNNPEVYYESGQFSITEINYTVIAHYPFHGNANDESGNNNNGTVNGAVLTADRFGNPNNAYQFDGVDDYIDLGNDNSMKPDFPASLSIWLNPGTEYNQGVLFANDEMDGTAYYNGLFVYLNPSGQVSSNIGGGFAGPSSRRTFTTNDSISLNGWTHVVIIWESATSRQIYFNGVLQNGTWDNGTATGIRYTSAAAAFGWSLASNQPYFGGSLDDIYFYNKALSQTEVNDLYAEPNPQLVAYYPFNGNANDESGYENHGTVNGATLTTDRFGVANKAYSFDGTDDYISKASEDINRYFTISGWVYVDNLANRQILYSERCNHSSYNDGNRNRVYVCRDNNGDVTNKFTFYIRTKAGQWNDYDQYVLWTQNTYTENRWYYICAVRNNEVLKLYIDGQEQICDIYEFGHNANLYDLRDSYNNEAYIGKFSASSMWHYGSGIVDDLRIYNRALSDQEILDLYHEGGWTGK